jgi:NADH dehydrogenase [ubiquinone] 1 alpha subcomplex assembly factor 7
VSRDSGVTARLARLIERVGSIPLSLFMAEANGHYYATRDPLGVDGDFTTAPEISQMFGELIGLWAADLAFRARAEHALQYVELGPGRGTLAADALRAMAGFGVSPPVHLVETSPVLRDLAAVRLPTAQFHYDLSGLPNDTPLIIVANEFFDALPIRQVMRTEGGWRERQVAYSGDRFVPVPGLVPLDAAIPEMWRDEPVGTIIEQAPAGTAIVADLAQRLAAQGGAMLIIDYGYAASQPGNTLQAIARHAYADPFTAPGEQDLTAHVDFAALKAAAVAEGLIAHGPVGQGDFLRALGIEARAAALGGETGGEAVAAQLHRLTAAEEMGRLFKVMALTAPDWPVPEGFAA